MIIAKNKINEIDFDLSMANRHGLIAGATGTGKTVTLKVLAETFSKNGIPVFLSDVKGDLSGFAIPNSINEKLQKRLDSLEISDFEFDSFPVVFWDLYGEAGHPIKTTISQMGPLLLAQVLQLNETQGQVLSIIFKIADDNGLLLLDTKDLKAMLNYVSDNATELKNEYGNISSASVGAILRSLIVLENEGGERFFGEPALNIADFLQTEQSKGVINLLNASKLINSPKLYSSFLLWLLSELFEELPEVGDLKKPKFVFFFDEAHLLFDNAPKSLLDKIEQVVRLIRSKGVGVYFITQSPLDIPDGVLGQLGNKFMHALRAYTPKDQKTIKAVSESFRQDKNQNLEEIITSLAVGEALVSTLDENATPKVVQRAFVLPPQSSFAPISATNMKAHIQNSVIFGVYEKEIDRESAYEILNAKATANQEELQNDEPTKESQSEVGKIFGAFASSAARAIGSQVGRQIVRGLLGAILGEATGTRRRR